MKLYKVKNWEVLYENSRSRSVDNLRWVPIPNHHDGEHYSRLMLRKDSAEIFSAWILILQVSSRCHPRGTLVRSDGKPHDSESLSIKTRAPMDWFTRAIPVLLQMSWIEQVTTDCQEGDRQVTPACHPSAEEGREGMEGMELNGREGNSQKPEPGESGEKEPNTYYNENFLKFWSVYPRKVQKGTAYRAWKKNCCDSVVEAILLAVSGQAIPGARLGVEIKYVPHPASWLNGRGWEDELSLPPDLSKKKYYFK